MSSAPGSGQERTEGDGKKKEREKTKDLHSVQSLAYKNKVPGL